MIVHHALRVTRLEEAKVVLTIRECLRELKIGVQRAPRGVGRGDSGAGLALLGPVRQLALVHGVVSREAHHVGHARVQCDMEVRVMFRTKTIHDYDNVRRGRRRWR